MIVNSQPTVDDVGQKLHLLQQAIAEYLPHGLVVAYSGGVDSAFLLWAAAQEQKKSGGKLLAMTADSPSLASTEKADATQFAQSLGVTHRWQASLEFSNPNYLKNGLDRCYHCKTELFAQCKSVAGEVGYRFIAYGYNASDKSDFRPGHRAATENSIQAPLEKAGLTKDDIRALMRSHGIRFADKPATPCLSSRVMTGVGISPAKLQHIEALETLLREAGLNVFRVRLHESAQTPWIRIEVPLEEMPHVLACRDSLVKAAKSRGFAWVTLDLAGYKTGGANLHSPSLA